MGSESAPGIDESAAGRDESAMRQGTDSIWGNDKSVTSDMIQPQAGIKQ